MQEIQLSPNSQTTNVSLTREAPSNIEICISTSPEGEQTLKTMQEVQLSASVQETTTSAGKESPLDTTTQITQITSITSTETSTDEQNQNTKSKPSVCSQTTPELNEIHLLPLFDKIKRAKQRVWRMLLPLAGIATIISLVCIARLDFEHMDKDIAIMQAALAIFAGMIAIKNSLEAHKTWNKVKMIRRRMSEATTSSA